VINVGALLTLHPHGRHLIGLRRCFTKQGHILVMLELRHIGRQKIKHRLADAPIHQVCHEGLDKTSIGAEIASVAILVVDRDGNGIHQLLTEVQLLRQLCFRLLACSNVGANRDVFIRNRVLVQKRNNRRSHPVLTAILGAIADFAMPDLALRDRRPHPLVKLRSMARRLDDAMITPQQLLTIIATDTTKLVVGVEDVALCIGNTDDRMIIKGKLEVIQLQALLFTLLHQVGDNARQRLKFILRPAAANSLATEQLADRLTERLCCTRFGFQVAAQATVDRIQLRRTQFQAARAQGQVAV